MRFVFRFGATTVLVFNVAQFAVAQSIEQVRDFVSDALIDVSVTPPQESLGFAIGQICPGGLRATDQDLQDRCDELVDGTLGVISGSASGTDQAGAREGLQAMAPEEDAVVASSQVDAGSAQIDNVGNRLSSLRGGVSGGVVYRYGTGFNWAGGAAGDEQSSPWGIFVNGLYTTSDRDSTLRESGFEADDYGVTAGIDYSFDNSLVLGVAFGYKDSDADIDANGGKLETDSYSVFGYWSIYPDEHWYVDAMVGYTNNDHEQQRNVIYSITAASGASGGAIVNTSVNNSALSDTESDEISVSIAAGRNFYRGSWTLAPYARVEYADVDIDGFTERMSQTTAAGKGLALQIDDQDFKSVMATLGGQVTTEWRSGFGMLYPQASVEYVHEFKNGNDPITGRFVNDSSGTTFTLLTDPPDRNFVNIGAGLTAVFSDTVAGFFRYQGLLGYEDLDVHAFEFGIRATF